MVAVSIMQTMKSVLISLVCCTVIIGSRASRLTSGSIDLGSHLAFVSHIRETLSVPQWQSFAGVNPVPYLGTMAFYPPVSHVVAAGLAGVLGSDLYGLNAVAVLSIFAFYAVLSAILIRHGRILGACALSLIVVFLASLKVFHGDEVFGNFFFAQMFGTSSALICLYLCTCLLSGWTAVAISCLVANGLGWTYLLSDVVFSASFLVFLTVEVFIASRRSRSVAVGGVLKLAAASLSLCAVVVLHPQFVLMRRIAGNDGAMDPTLPLPAIALAGLGVLCIAVHALHRRRGDSAVVDLFVVSYATGIVAVLSVQLAALLVIDAGSPYAVRKLTFDVFTALALLTAHECDRVLRPRIRIRAIGRAEAIDFGNALGLIVTIAICLSFPSTDARRYPILSRYERDIFDLQLPPDAEGHTASLVKDVVGLSAYDPILNFALDQSVFHVPFAEALSYSLLGDPASARYAIVSASDPLARSASCLLSKETHLGIVAVDYPCASAAAATADPR